MYCPDNLSFFGVLALPNESYGWRAKLLDGLILLVMLALAAFSLYWYYLLFVNWKLALGLLLAVVVVGAIDEEFRFRRPEKKREEEKNKAQQKRFEDLKNQGVFR